MILRNYQDYAVKEMVKATADIDCAAVGVAPTGVGKSLILAGFIKYIFTVSSYPSRVLVLAHVKELLDQNSATLGQLFPEVAYGIYSSGLGRKELDRPVTFAGIASIYRKAEELGRVDVVLIDECHLVGEKESSMYVMFLTALKNLNPHLRVLGVTATPFRMGMGMLVDGNLFKSTCFDLGSFEAFNWFLDQGYLCHLRTPPTKTVFDTTGIRITGGDYNLKDQNRVLNVDDKTRAVVDEIIEYGVKEGRQHWLLFCVSIEHVESVARLLNEAGIKTTYVHSKMKEKERDANILAYKEGEYQAMVNNGVLTTGFDYKAIDLIGVIRLINSPGLWGQILGRGTRPLYMEGFDLTTREGRLQAIATSEKPDCLVLDFGNNISRLGPINDLVMPKKKGKGKGEAPIRVCDGCGNQIHASLTMCPHCGQEYARSLGKFDTSVNHEDVIAKTKRSKAKEPEAELAVWMNVDSITFKLNSGRLGRPDTITVYYNVGLSQFATYLCFDHPVGHTAHREARRWWRLHVADTPYENEELPVNVQEAYQRLRGEVNQPKSIQVVVNSKFKNVKNYDFKKRVEEK